tara:strand:- start:1525 stop:2385 length:861 start_codon:yes stop_codon:yes gene_type:complete
MQAQCGTCDDNGDDSRGCACEGFNFKDFRPKGNHSLDLTNLVYIEDGVAHCNKHRQPILLLSEIAKDLADETIYPDPTTREGATVCGFDRHSKHFAKNKFFVIGCDAPGCRNKQADIGLPYALHVNSRVTCTWGATPLKNASRYACFDAKFREKYRCDTASPSYTRTQARTIGSQTMCPACVKPLARRAPVRLPKPGARAKASASAQLTTSGNQGEANPVNPGLGPEAHALSRDVMLTPEERPCMPTTVIVPAVILPAVMIVPVVPVVPDVFLPATLATNALSVIP